MEYSTIDELPSSLGLLTQLICLHARRVTVPNGIIDKLTSLQELRIGDVKNDTTGQFVVELGNLLELRVLDARVDMTDLIVESYWVETLGKLHKLQHLEIMNISQVQAIWDLAVLPRPLQHFIALDFDFPVLPSSINPSNLPNLTRMALSVHHMNEQNLRILGGLPELRHLGLRVLSTVTVNVDVDDDGFFQKLVYLDLPWSTVHLALNEDTTISFTVWNPEDNVVFGSGEKGEECIVRAPSVMRNLRLLHFYVDVEALVRNNGSCDRLGLEYLPSLQNVVVRFTAWLDDNKRREKGALRHAIEVHPNRPTLNLF